MSNRKPYNCFGCGRKCTDAFRLKSENPVCENCYKVYENACANDERRKAKGETRNHV